jgi:hypothetical protein
MRPVCVAVSVAAIAVAATAAAAADADVKVVYGVPPVTVLTPPTGYLLDPSDQVNPVYVVNQGPVLSGPGIYSYTNVLYYPSQARRTYSEGGYAYTDPPYYPWSALYGYPYAYPYDYPYVTGGLPCAADVECSPAHFYRHLARRPYGYAPYTAYRYRPAAGARVIQVPSDGK